MTTFNITGKIAIYNLCSNLSNEIIDGPYLKYSQASRMKIKLFKDHNLDTYVSESFLNKNEFVEFAEEFEIKL